MKSRSANTWTTVEDLRLIRYTKACVPVAEIGVRLGRSYSAIITRRMYLKQVGKLTRLGYAGHQTWTKAEEMDLRERWEDGASIAQLARRFNRTLIAVRIKLKRMGLRARHDRRALTSRDVQRMMGMGCAKQVIVWVERGWLKAQRSGRCRKGTWRFDEFAVWDFVEKPDAFMAYDPQRITDPGLRAHAIEHRAKHPRWLRVGEVARRYHVGVGAVNDWIARGEFPLEALVKYPNWWIREDVLDGFVPPCERPRQRDSWVNVPF